MAHRETDLDHLTTLLGQCLGRIDERAYQLQRSRDDEEDFEASDVLERETALLQELISSVLEHSIEQVDADLNEVVRHTLQGCVAEFAQPVVVRTRYGDGLPRVACAPGQLSYAVQRALMLLFASLEPGGELLVDTRADGDGVLLEVESHGVGGGSHIGERSATLADFVADLGGSCCCDNDGRGASMIAMQLPVILIPD